MNIKNINVLQGRSFLQFPLNSKITPHIDKTDEYVCDSLTIILKFDID